MSPFTQFGLMILVVLGVSSITRILKQPLVIGYILSGILVGPLCLNLIHHGEILNVFSEIGITFLLFVVGLHLSPKIIKEVGKISLFTGLGQIIFTSLVGYFIGVFLGFSSITAIYIAIALTFSSTIIIMKLLSDKEALEKLYGKITVGFLLVQDLIAILILIIVSSLASGGQAGDVLLFTLLKGVALTVLLIPASFYIVPKITDFCAKSQEFLFLFAIAWGFGLSTLFLVAGFSIEVGALIAGVTLSMSPYGNEIGSKLKPIRDFFIVWFFVILGSQMAFGQINHLLVPAIVFSLFILIGNPLIVMILMGFFGYSKKNGFMAGLTVAQISEFSLILIALGVKTGSLEQEILSFVTMIGLITIAGSTYMIIYSDFIFDKISKFLTVFERKNLKEKRLPQKIYDHILFGCNRVGFSLVKTFSELNKDLLVVDYNPETVKTLQEEGVNALYGDADDAEFLEDLKIGKASLVVSTIPQLETNKLILNVLKRTNSKSATVMTSRQIQEAFDLYDSGTDYVVLPYFLGGEYTSKLVKRVFTNKAGYKKERNKELKLLKERLKKGHIHPHEK